MRRRYILEWRLFALLSLKLVQKSRYICKISSYTGILRYNIVVSCMTTSDHCSILSTFNSANIQIDELFRDFIFVTKFPKIRTSIVVLFQFDPYNVPFSIYISTIKYKCLRIHKLIIKQLLIACV